MLCDIFTKIKSLSHSEYDVFHVKYPSAAHERQIVLFPTHFYDTKIYLKNSLCESSRQN